MRVYHLPLPSVMDMPMKTFWHLQGSIDRLLADEQKELLEILTSAHSPEASQAMHEALSKRSPSPIKLGWRAMVEMTSARDEEGLNELRAM